MELHDANAFDKLAGWYHHGENGLPQDDRKAFKLFQRGAELGSIQAHYFLGLVHTIGEGVEQDDDKAMHYFGLAAIGGHEQARYTLGMYDEEKGNIDRAMKHFMIAARCGYDKSLKAISKGYKAELVTKEDYASTLRAHRASQDEMKSEQRAIAEEWEQLEK